MCATIGMEVRTIDPIKDKFQYIDIEENQEIDIVIDCDQLSWVNIDIGY